MTGMILPICPDVCPLVDDIVSQCSLEFFRNNEEFPNVNQLLDDFVCLEPQSYYNFPIQYISTDDCSAFSKWIIDGFDIHIHMYIYMRTYMHMYTYIDTYVHTYVYTYTHMYIHTYIHTHIHTYMYV